MERVVAYIDGFNLYFGMKAKGWRKFYWLNVKELATHLLSAGQTLVRTKYFTARVKNDPDKHRRQKTYLEALETLDGVDLVYGQYLVNDVTCLTCGHVRALPKEKMTDVNIAVEMLRDAFQNVFDVALLISADSDLTPPVRAIRELFPDKRVVVLFPPERTSYELEKAAHAAYTIGRNKFSKSVLPPRVTKADGYVLERPLRWT